ncbi:ABC transporter permease subunit [Puerhibacterium puerhi]|uniref:ABC transporter permease subunit n=1 Tax=Puerhibacterium puerhi TaxID=2692623 RepID=UPI001F3753B9|nr:ABC transporter permease subunit [Puerhibacterium puerhi]
MSAHAVAAPRAARPAAGRGAMTFRGVLAAEWTKVTSLRAPYWAAAATAVACGLLTYVSANASSVDPGFDPLDSLTSGVLLAQVGPLVLGVLVGTGEFATGTFRTTFATVPRRLPVLAAQVVVTAAFAVVAALLAVIAAVAGILPAASGRGIAVDLTADGTPQVLVGTALYLVGLALCGLAAGALLRRTVPALVGILVLVLVLPVGLSLATDGGTGPAAPAGAVPADPASTLVTFTPSGAASFLTAPPGGGGVAGAPDLGPWGAAAVLAAWALVPLVAAAVRLRRRDLV